MNIVPFETNAVPAFLQEQAQTANEDLLAHASASFSVMSIKGKVFTVTRGDEKRIVPNPKDPNAPAYAINVIIIKVSKNNSKTYYMTQFKEGEDAKPACFSNDGVRPDPASEHPQCKTCAACKWNMFGTSRGQDGKLGKGKACSDSVRMAICDVTNVHEPMMLRVPPASIKAIGEYGRQLARRKVPYQAVVTEISFVAAEATPRLQFRPVGYLDEATYREVLEEAKSETVETIVNGFAHAPAEEQTSTASTAPAVQAAPAAQAAPVVQEGKPATPESEADAIIARAMSSVPKDAPSTAEKPAAAAPQVIAESADELSQGLADLGWD